MRECSRHCTAQDYEYSSHQQIKLHHYCVAIAMIISSYFNLRVTALKYACIESEPAVDQSLSN